MKRILATIISIIILTLCCACGSSKPTIEGEWYHIDTGELYKFQDEHILCENNYIMFKGKKVSGGYEKHNDYYDTFIKGIHNGNTIKLYIIKYNNTLALSTTPDDSGKLLFIKSKEVVDTLMTKRETQRKLEKEKQKRDFEIRKNLEEEKKLAELNAAIKMPPVTYESIISGQHTNKLVAIEVIIDAISYDKYWDEYKFDAYYWSEENQTFVVSGIKPTLCVKKVPSQVATVLPLLKNGDKLKVVTPVYHDDSFGLMESQYIEVISQGNIINKSKDFLSTSTYNSNSYGKSTKISKSYGSISDIDISYTKDYIDGNKMYLKVYVKNNSSAMFKGDVHVFFYSVDGKKRLGSDMIIIEKLMPGQTSWAKVKIDKYLGTPKIETNFTNPQFIDVSPISTEIDLELTKKTSNSVRLNFDVASWYKNIESIEVYTDRTCIVSSTSAKDNTTIASAVWSCGKQYGVKSVQVVDAAGNIKAVYPN